MANMHIPTVEEYKILEEKILQKMGELFDEKLKQEINTELIVYTSSHLELKLHVTANTIKKYRDEGLPYIRIANGEYRYIYQDVVNFLSDNRYTKLRKRFESES